MNKTILGAILVLALMVLVSATTVSVMTVKPAKPVEVFTDWYAISSSLTSDIKKYHKMGYVVKTVTSGGGEGSKYILVMEKY